MSTLRLGHTYLLQGAKLLLRPGVFLYAILPVVINTALFTLLILFSIGQFGAVLTWLMSQLPAWLQWLDWLLWVLFSLAMVLVMFSTFTLFAAIISAPFNGLLSEAVERHLTGKAPAETGMVKTLREIPLTLKNELHKIGYFARFAIPLLLLHLIPGINVLAPFLWFFFSAWMLALEFSDYPLGNHGIPFSRQRELIRNHKLPVFSFGVITTLAAMIPFINLIVIPSAVAGATAFWVERFSQQDVK